MSSTQERTEEEEKKINFHCAAPISYFHVVSIEQKIKYVLRDGVKYSTQTQLNLHIFLWIVDLLILCAQRRRTQDSNRQNFYYFIEISTSNQKRPGPSSNSNRYINTVLFCLVSLAVYE
jgi:hypothetical protein